MANVKTLISIDAGKSTGIAVGTYSDTEPFKLTYAFQIEGGVVGFNKWFRFRDDLREEFPSVIVQSELVTERVEIEFLAEKFNARGQGNGFSYTTESLEALRVEGAIIAKGLDPIWVQPAQQYFAGGESKSSTTNAHRWLKANGLHITGKDVNCKDANDARSAILHCISYLRHTGHKPTIEKYFPKQEEE